VDESPIIPIKATMSRVRQAERLKDMVLILKIGDLPVAVACGFGALVPWGIANLVFAISA
jgi:hypothetical protein